jgi:hypothetical protein
MKTKLLIGIISVSVAILMIILLLHQPSKRPTITQQQPATHSQTNIPATNKPVTAGGKPIPADSAERAKSLGYYCPSWDAQAGAVTSSVCIKLDK